MKINRKNHPERKENESWIGNYTQDDFKQIRFKTKRMGLVALSTEGKKLHQDWNVRPVFVDAKEYDES